MRGTCCLRCVIVTYAVARTHESDDHEMFH